MIEVYCLHLIDLPKYLTSKLKESEDCLLIDYNQETDLINLIMAGEEALDGEYITNTRKLNLDYPIKPTGELKNICEQYAALSSTSR